MSVTRERPIRQRTIASGFAAARAVDFGLMPLLDRQTIIEALARRLPVRVRLLIEEMFDDRP